MNQRVSSASAVGRGAGVCGEPPASPSRARRGRRRSGPGGPRGGRRGAVRASRSRGAGAGRAGEVRRLPGLDGEARRDGRGGRRRSSRRRPTLVPTLLVARTVRGCRRISPRAGRVSRGLAPRARVVRGVHEEGFRPPALGPLDGAARESKHSLLAPPRRTILPGPHGRARSCRPKSSSSGRARARRCATRTTSFLAGPGRWALGWIVVFCGRARTRSSPSCTSLVGGVANVRPRSFWDAFCFSVQTMGTIGYGSMYPTSVAANRSWSSSR